MTSRVALLVALMVASAASGFAQGKVWGVKGGVDIASATQAGQDPLKNAAGGIGGLFMRAGVSVAGRSLAIQPEVLLSRQGGSGNGEELKCTELSSDPCAAAFRCGGHQRSTVHRGGAGLGHQVDRSSEEPGSLTRHQGIDAGIAAGAGLFVSSRVSLEGRYTQGLMDVATDAGHAGDIGPGKVKNRVISIMLGIGIPR